MLKTVHASAGLCMCGLREVVAPAAGSAQAPPAGAATHVQRVLEESRARSGVSYERLGADEAVTQSRATLETPRHGVHSCPQERHDGKLGSLSGAVDFRLTECSETS